MSSSTGSINGHASLWFFTCSSTLCIPICKTSSVSVRLYEQENDDCNENIVLNEKTCAFGTSLSSELVYYFPGWASVGQNTYTELDDAFCGAVVIELRAIFFSVLALFLLLALSIFLLAFSIFLLAVSIFLLALFGTFVDFFANSFPLPLEAFVFDSLESVDFNAEEELSIMTWPVIEDNELFVCRPDDLAAFLDVLIVGDIFHLDILTVQ